MGPLEATKPWSTQGVEGVYRFLDRVWRLFVDEDGATGARSTGDEPPTEDAARCCTGRSSKVTEDIEALRFNTAIAQMMEFVNELTKLEPRARAPCSSRSCCCSRRSRRTWPRSCGSGSGHGETLAYEPWPAYDPALVRRETRHGRRPGERQAARDARAAARRRAGRRRRRPRSPTSACSAT